MDASITVEAVRELGLQEGAPIAHVRDARSLLMLKLLFLTRREADVEPLLSAQRAHFATLAERLMVAAEEAGVAACGCVSACGAAGRAATGLGGPPECSRQARGAGAPASESPSPARGRVRAARALSRRTQDRGRGSAVRR